MPSAGQLDFDGLARRLLANPLRYLEEWLPGGKLRGAEYVCGDLRGGPGDSLQVNIHKGAWADFATDVKGGDLIALYAAVRGIKQGEAAKELADREGYELSERANGSSTSAPAPEPKKALAALVPPEDVGAPAMIHETYGRPSASWRYAGVRGETLFFVARYETPNGKELRPWSWDGKRWIAKAWPSPRPLYGLKDLADRPDAPVVVVEGEKAAEAARRLVGHVYAVVTWPNGSKAVAKADWTPLRGRKVLLWPDADKPGRDAAREIANVLSPACPEIKLIDPSGVPEGWDAADAVAAGWTFASFRSWAAPRVGAAAVAVATATATATVTVSSPDDNGHVSASAFATWERLGLAMTNNGQPIVNADNLLRILTAYEPYKDLVWFDEFHCKYLTKWGDGRVREWSEADTVKLTILIQRELGVRRASKETVYDALIAASIANSRNEPREWLDSLSWDGTERIAGSFARAFGAGGSEYVRAASKNFWVGLAARVYRPGCQLDNMVVLEGSQGTGKTSALRVIGGAWHVEAHESVTSKDFFMMLQGKLVVEIAELDSFNRAEVTRIKQVISCPVDRYRAPYGKSAADYPRRCVFVGTTNEEAYLRDPTGGRRFWPVRAGAIDLGYLRAEREQLFAEGAAAFKAGAPWYEMPDAETKAMQEGRRHADTWEEVVTGWLPGKDEVTTKEVLVEALGFEVARISRADEMRVASVLRSVGMKRKDSWRSGKCLKVWALSSEEQEEAPF